MSRLMLILVSVLILSVPAGIAQNDLERVEEVEAQPAAPVEPPEEAGEQSEVPVASPDGPPIERIPRPAAIPDQLSPKKKTGVPVVVAGEELFRVRAKLGPYTPEIRAHSIEKRLQELENRDDRIERINSISTRDGDFSTDITAGDLTLMTVTTLDAKFEGLEDRTELASRYSAKLRDALLREIESRSPEVMLTACGLSALATILFLASLCLVNWIFPRIYGVMARWRGTVIRPLKIQQAQLLSADTITDVAVGFFRALRVLLFLVLFGVYVYAILSFFPQTRPLVQDGIKQLAGPVVDFILPIVLGFLPNLGIILAVVAASYYTTSFTHFIFREIERGTIQIPGFEREWSDPTFKIARFLIAAFALVLLFPYLPGSGSPAFQQVSIFLGLLFSLASTGPLSHVIAGIFLTYTGAMRVGDRVKIADTVGDVIEKTLLATRIQTIKNEVITIPNGLVLGNHIVNYSSSSQGTGLILNATITIGYDVPWKDIEAALIKAARDTDGVESDPEPFVWQTGLGDFSVSYQINAFTRAPNRMGAIYSQLNKNIQDKCNEAGIEILSPTYAAIRDGNHSTIPSIYLPSDYRSPGFNLSK